MTVLKKGKEKSTVGETRGFFPNQLARSLVTLNPVKRESGPASFFSKMYYVEKYHVCLQ